MLLKDAPLSWEILLSAFPFHMVLDRSLRVTGVGPSLAKIGVGIKPGGKLAEYFAVKSPDVKPEFNDLLEQSHTVFFLRDHGEKIVLKGQMVHVPGGDGDLLLYLCSPVLSKMAGAAELNLTLKDFPLHDTTVDHLILMQTQSNVLRDTRRMADRLKEEIKSRRKAQEDLEESNAGLEIKVRERTAELEQANSRMALWLHELKERNREMTILNAMGKRLQNCRALKEAFPIIREAFEELAPDSSGRPACRDEEAGAFVVGLDWGSEHPFSGPLFGPEQCSALVDGKERFFDGGSSGRICPKLGSPSGHGYICRPLRVNDEILGLVHLRYAADGGMPGPDGDHPGPGAEGRRKLITTFSEQIALSLANLRMQEVLQEQSIREPLTGLYNRRHMEDALEREVSRCERSGGTIGIILMDVDHFKAFNDNHGHQAGDRVLSALGGMLKRGIRDGDIACRYGGEEFLVILPGASSGEVLVRAEEFRARVEEGLRLTHEGKSLGKITVSMGVACFPENGRDGGEVVRAADSALYRAKHQGRNRVTPATSDEAAVDRSL